MEDQEKVEPEYLRGFNEGYLMAQHKPELAQQLASIDSDFIRLVGFRDGHQQHQIERTKTRLPTWLREDRADRQQEPSARTKDRDVEPEK